jgi:hypothetical protein
MSQTETLLLVALGFALAIVFFMVFGFAMWSAANRWSAFRRRKEIPTTILDMQSEREALRASNAMTTVRFETLLQKSRDEAAEKTAEVSRHRNRVVLLSREIDAKNAEIAALLGQVKDLTVETNARAQIIARLTGKEVANLRAVPETAEQPIAAPVIFVKPSMPVPPLEVAKPIEAPADKLKTTIAGINAAAAEMATAKIPSPEHETVKVDDLRTASEALDDPAPKSADIIDFKRAEHMSSKSLADRFRNLANGIKADGDNS